MIANRDRLIIYAAIDLVYMHIQDLFDDERMSTDGEDVLEFILNAVDIYMENNPGELDEEHFDEYIYYSGLNRFGKKEIVDDKFMDEPEEDAE